LCKVRKLKMEATEKQKQLMDKMKIDYPKDITKDYASQLIDKEIQKERAPKEKEYQPSQKDYSFFVSYAKDVCCTLIAQNIKDKEGNRIPTDDLMDVSVHVIQKAIQTFKQ